MIMELQKRRVCRVGSLHEPTRSLVAVALVDILRSVGICVGPLRGPTLREIGTAVRRVGSPLEPTRYRNIITQR